MIEKGERLRRVTPMRRGTIRLAWHNDPAPQASDVNPPVKPDEGDGTVDVQETKENNSTVVGILILIAVIVLITFMFLLWQANTL